MRKPFAAEAECGDGSDVDDEFPNSLPATPAVLSDHAELVERDFDSIARDYQKLHRANAYDDLVLRAIGPLPALSSAIEVGCGTGRFCRTLARVASSVIGVDVSREMLRIAEHSELPDNVRLIQSDASKIGKGVSAGRFDIVVSKFVLHDMEHPEESLANWIRLAKPGGRIVILDRYWESSIVGKFISFIKMEFWLWQFFRQFESVSSTLKLLFEDLYEWFSAEWRQHRKHEVQRAFFEWRELFLRVAPHTRISRVNSRAFVAVIEC